MKKITALIFAKVVNCFPIRRIQLIGITTAISFSTLFIEHCSAQWYQINLPVSGQVHMMQFINSNTGWLRMTNGNFLKSTNGGANWQYLSDTSNHVYKFQFINDTLGYATGVSYLTPLFLKTTNGGLNWNTIFYPNPYSFSGIYFINKDTGWVDASIYPYDNVSIFRTTNGCQTFENMYTRSSQNVANQESYLKFFRNPSDNQYYGYHQIVGKLWKTTNSGSNWTQINTGFTGNINSFSFINKDTGWVVQGAYTTHSGILKTTNNGNNWLTQYDYPLTANYEPAIISAVSNNIIYCSILNYNYKILKSTNNGYNWGNQISPIINNGGIYFYDTSIGFAWGNLIVRTTNGGGTIMSIRKISETTPSKIELKQNYPNPFNSETTIEYSIPKTSIVSLIVYDILGRELIKLINSQDFSSGNYKYTLNLINFNLSSGIYIYKMAALEKSGGNIFQEVKKMIYNK